MFVFLCFSLPKFPKPNRKDLDGLKVHSFGRTNGNADKRNASKPAFFLVSFNHELDFKFFSHNFV